MTVSFGSLPDAQYTSTRWLLWGAYQPLAKAISETSDLSGCFSRYQPFTGNGVSIRLRPEADVEDATLAAVLSFNDERRLLYAGSYGIHQIVRFLLRHNAKIDYDLF
jgi:hypothetical protein